MMIEVIILWISLFCIGGVIGWILFEYYKSSIRSLSKSCLPETNLKIIRMYSLTALKLLTIMSSILIVVFIIKACSQRESVKIDKSKLSSDVKSLAYFYNLYAVDHPPEYNKQLKKFKKRISNYKDEEIKIIKSFSKLYIAYHKTFHDDFLHAVIDYIPKTEFAFKTCNETDNLKLKLYSYNIKDNLDLEDEEVQKVVNELKDKFPKYSYDEVIEMKEMTINNDQNIGEMMDVIYKNIFIDK